MLFINTRPTDRAQALSQNLIQAGIDTIELPLLELSAHPFSNELKALYSQLLKAQMIVVVSPTAVEIGMRYLQQSGVQLSQLQHIEWIAVGQMTAQALAKYQISSHVPEVETSEGMLGLSIFEHVQPLSKIAFWRGEGGRQFMMQQCQARQLEVLNFILYERHLPATSLAQYRTMLLKLDQMHQPYVVCISSEASWLNWLQLNQENLKLVDQCHYLVLGERLYQILQQYKKKMTMCFNISTLPNLKTVTVLQQIQLLQRNI
ncbi:MULTISPECIES: uroporphyrinogen-III synthase [Acinetobacter]|uniref:uroporphyrinogen-III synthase n=1 Tax=Acinetobacter TaxID=469 RepID=UPI00102285AB|nr:MULTISPECIES: uroporphyrinogen-III synthase [Acinetobacter]RYL25378.1 uroporphyrinogen-III synthase [Acinetobacter piscicola]